MLRRQRDTLDTVRDLTIIGATVLLVWTAVRTVEVLATIAELAAVRR